MTTDTVTISRKEYDSLLEDSHTLSQAYAYGVDNWEGWMQWEEDDDEEDEDD